MTSAIPTTLTVLEIAWDCTELIETAGVIKLHMETAGESHSLYSERVIFSEVPHGLRIDTSPARKGTQIV